MTTYILKPRIPGGTWLAILLLIIGFVATALSLAVVISVPLRVVGVIIAILGLALLTITVVRMRQLRVWVSFDDEGYVIESATHGEISAAWRDVVDVAVSRKTAKIALWTGPNRRTIIAHPAGRMDDEFMAIREGIRTHLEALDAEPEQEWQ